MSIIRYRLPQCFHVRSLPPIWQKCCRWKSGKVKVLKQIVSEEKHVFPSRAIKKEIERRIRAVQMDAMIMNDLGELTKIPNFEPEVDRPSFSIVSSRYLASNPSKFSSDLASIKAADILTRNRPTEPDSSKRVKSSSENVHLPLGQFTEVRYSEDPKSASSASEEQSEAASPYDRGFHVEGDVYKDEYVAGAITDMPAEKELDDATLSGVDSSSVFTRSDRQNMIQQLPYRIRFGVEDAVEEIDFTLPTQELPEDEKPFRKWRRVPPHRSEDKKSPFRPADKVYLKQKAIILDDKGFGEETENEEWKQYYGTADRSVKPADEKHRCGGCGATFHCQDASLPGFLPAQLFLEKKEREDFSGTICRRCYLVQRHQFLVNVSVSPIDYERVLGHLRTVEEALILLLVDMTDFPACIYPKLPDLIGRGKPLIVVGNKVDLLPPDAEKGYVHHFQRCLRRAVIEMGFAERMNLLSVELISAKTGYGTEALISLIFSKWGNRGDIYLIGCTNTGKSTLFNALLQSDLCKIRAVDLLERATTSLWPGTTLNLLKFPVMNPTSYRLVERRNRLRFLRKIADAEEQHRRVLLEETGESKYMMLQGKFDPTLFQIDLLYSEGTEARRRSANRI